MYAALVLSACLAVLAYRQSGLHDNDALRDEASDIDQIRYLNAAIDRQVLLLESGRRVDFDKLTAYAKDLGDMTRHSDAFRDTGQNVLAAGLRQKVERIEDFKSRLAIYRNSARVGDRLALELNAGMPADTPGARAIETVIETFLAHLAFDDAAHVRALEAALQATRNLQVSEGQRSAWQAFRAHASLVVRVRPELVALTRSIADPAYSKSITTVARGLGRYHQELEHYGSRWRIALLASALLFATLLTAAVRMNLQKTRDLERLNDDLESRVTERTHELAIADQELREALDDVRSQQRSLLQLSSAIHHAADGVAILSSDLTVLFANPAYAARKDVTPLLERCRDDAGNDPEARETWTRIDGDFLLNEIPPALTQAGQGLEQISGIVLAMRNFAHPGSQQKEDTDVNASIRDTVTIARNEWKYVAEMQVDLDDSVLPISAVRSSLNQVWLNVIVNAAHAIRDKVGDSGDIGRIRVTSRAVDDGLQIRINDTGCGIAEQHRTRVFDPFFTTKEVGKGSGQGLSIAHGIIVEQHGGRIEIESELGAGTTFVITLPRETGEMPLPALRTAS